MDQAAFAAFVVAHFTITLMAIASAVYFDIEELAWSFILILVLDTYTLIEYRMTCAGLLFQYLTREIAGVPTL